jgi:hypothetical protein
VEAVNRLGPDHFIVKLTEPWPGYFVMKQPETTDAEYVRCDAPLLVMVDGPFGSYEHARGYVLDVLRRRDELTASRRD